MHRRPDGRGTFGADFRPPGVCFRLEIVDLREKSAAIFAGYFGLLWIALLVGAPRLQLCVYDR